MSIKAKDTALLWGRAAGRCSKPECGEDCAPYLAEQATVLGEMAHVIAQSPNGPRGVPSGGADTYDNLVLLCPTHHKTVDKAPDGMFPPELLHEWKRQHEERVAEAQIKPIFSTFDDLRIYIRALLIENKSVWELYGPESAEAKSNPISNSSKLWVARKLSTIVPNNRKIITAIRANTTLFDIKSFEAATHFIEHAEGFERNCFERIEGIPTFPVQFAEVIYDGNRV